MRDPKERLRDILDAIANIERYAARGRVAFETDEVIQNSFVRHLQIIGEAAYAIPRELRDQHPGISWAKMTGMRHVVIQDHFMIDDDIVWDDLDRELVWDTVQRDLPDLKHKIDQMLRQLEENRQGKRPSHIHPFPSLPVSYFQLSSFIIHPFISPRPRLLFPHPTNTFHEHEPGICSPHPRSS